MSLVNQLLPKPWGSLPAAISREIAAGQLGFKSHDIVALEKAGLLLPLGNPKRRGKRLYATVQILEIAESVELLSVARDAVATYNRERNGG